LLEPPLLCFNVNVSFLHGLLLNPVIFFSTFKGTSFNLKVLEYLISSLPLFSQQLKKSTLHNQIHILVNIHTEYPKQISPRSNNWNPNYLKRINHHKKFPPISQDKTHNQKSTPPSLPIRPSLFLPVTIFLFFWLNIL
jgi:hypothetical protein